MASVSDQPAVASDEWLTVPQAVRLLKVRRSRVLEFIDGGKLTCRHIPGTQRRISRASCNALIAAYTREADPTTFQ